MLAGGPLAVALTKYGYTVPAMHAYWVSTLGTFSRLPTTTTMET